MKMKPIFIVEAVFLTLVFFLVNIRSFVFWNQFPETDKFSGEAWREVFIWLTALLMMFYLLEKRNLIKDYLLTWLKEPILIGFVLFSLASVLWSDMWTVTLHRSLVFTFASVVAIFLGIRYSMSGFLQILYWFGAIIVVTSFLMVLLIPVLGTDFRYGYNGAWRGVFWHKNQLGNIVPILNLVFLVYFFSLKFIGARNEKILAVALYLLSLIEIFFANSASGYILVFLLHFIFGAALLWLKIRHLLRPIHYYITLAVVVVGIIGLFLNLGFVFGLLNRNSTLTGRVPMWTVILRDMFPRSPWVGQGFGTAWAHLGFRIEMMDLAGWDIPPGISDNGFLDILLNLGIIGLVLFLLNYIKVWIYSVRFFLRELSLEGFFPFIFMLYTLIASIPHSLFLELEVFIWMLIVVLMVITAQRRSEIHGV